MGENEEKRLQAGKQRWIFVEGRSSHNKITGNYFLVDDFVDIFEFINDITSCIFF